MKNHWILLLLVCMGLVACTSTNTQKPPECDYQSYDTYAEVVELKPHPAGEGRISVILDFKASKLALNPQELGELKDVFIDDGFLKKHNIRIGNKYEVLVTDLVRGDCEIKQTVAFSHRFK